MITAVFRVKKTTKGMTVHAEFTGSGPRARKRVQKKRFRDAYGSAASKLRRWIEDWEKSCQEDGIPTQHSIEVT